MHGRVCLVTGAARGIGAAAARVLASGGANVVVADISASGEDVARDIAADGGRAIFVGSDVSSDDGSQAAVAATLDEYGRLDSLINNAVILRLADSFEHTTDAQLSDMMRINF